MKMTEREFEAAVVKAAIDIACRARGDMDTMQIASVAARLVARAVNEAHRACPERHHRNRCETIAEAIVKAGGDKE